MDAAAFALARDNGLPIVVFSSTSRTGWPESWPGGRRDAVSARLSDPARLGNTDRGDDDGTGDRFRATRPAHGRRAVAR